MVCNAAVYSYILIIIFYDNYILVLGIYQILPTTLPKRYRINKYITIPMYSLLWFQILRSFMK